MIYFEDFHLIIFYFTLIFNLISFIYYIDNELQNEYQLLFTNHPKNKVLEGICSTHLIQGLEDKVKFYSKFTGLEVLNHEATHDGDEIICRQHGYVGSNEMIIIYITIFYDYNLITYIYFIHFVISFSCNRFNI